MAQTYFAILTAIGEAKLANATALGTTLQLTKMAVGDGNGATPIPNRNQTTLVHENRRAPLNTLFVDPANASQIVAEQIIPEDIGGWWIRELGLYDAAGDLCAVANCPDTYKPVLSSGSGRTQILRMVLIVANTSSVELKVDPSVVLAPRGYVDQVMTSHLAAVDPHPQYATDADLAAHNSAPDPHPQYLTSAEGDVKVAAAVAALVASSPAALDTLAELAAALGNDPNFATTITTALSAKAPMDSPSFSGQPKYPLGSAASPGLSFVGDTDTGLYSPGANQIGLAVAGASALLFDAFRQAYHYATQFNALPGANNHYELVNRNGAGLTFFTNAAARLAAHLDASGRLILGGGTAAAAGYTGVGDVTLPVGAGIRALNTCKAWAAINPATGAILDGVGINTVTRATAGVYTCTLAQALANVNYGVLGFAAGGPGETSFGVSENSGFTKTTSAFQIQTGNTESNFWADAARLYIFVFGRDA